MVARSAETAVDILRVNAVENFSEEMIRRSESRGRLLIHEGQGHSPGERMITIGLLGGMSAESTAQYYRLLNADVRQ